MMIQALLLATMLSAADGGVAPVAAPVPQKTETALSPEVKALVDRVQAFYEKTSDFTADFKQEYLYKTFKRTVVSTGTVTFKKPGLMRWEYEKATKKTFVLADKRVIAYDPEAKLLTRAAIDTNQLSASVTFLFGKGKLDSEFFIQKVECTKCVGIKLEMTPRLPDPRFKKIYLEVDEKTAQVLKSTVIDPDGSENAISFIGLKTNVGVKDDAFKVKPAPGTQVQDYLENGTPAPKADAGT